MKHKVYLYLSLSLIVSCSEMNSKSELDSEEAAPNVQLSRFPDKELTEKFATFEFSSDIESTHYCQLNEQDLVACESPYTVIVNNVGENTFSVIAESSNGVSSDASTYSWHVNSVIGDEVHQDIVQTQIQPDKAEPNSWRGIFRINCDFAHSSYDDPIVFPSQDNAAHLHRFYGNTLLDENSDLSSLFTTGESSCQGNILNRSAYWIPALLAPKYNRDTNQIIIDESGNMLFDVVPAVVGNDDEAHEVFYYSASVDDLESIQPIPLGLKMIAGDHMSMAGMEQDSSVVRWHCQSWESSDATNPQWSANIPECFAPDRLRMDVFFPSCWNGLDLDSEDHKSHLAYPVSSNDEQVCPSSHPVPIIRVSFHYAFGVKPDVYHPETLSTRGWRLASDMFEVSANEFGGYSLHADWFNAWDPEVLNMVLEGCIQNELDCHDGNLANGYRLSGTRPGTQSEPETISQSIGH